METIYTTENFEAIVEDRLALLTIKNNVFDLITSREKTDRLEEVLKYIQYEPKIKALLFISDPESLGEIVYDKFITDLAVNFDINSKYEVPQFCDKNLRAREIRILDELIEVIANYNKLCFSFVTGGVVTPFFGAYLATDIRFATSDTYFSLSHLKYGLHPSGALPYFLVQEVGYTKAVEIMLKDKLTAQEALDLGIVNRLIESKQSIEIVIHEVKKLIESRSCTLRRTKLMAAYARNTLRNYFDYERSLLNL